MFIKSSAHENAILPNELGLKGLKQCLLLLLLISKIFSLQTLATDITGADLKGRVSDCSELTQLLRSAFGACLAFDTSL
jgi:hypothetical protein